MGMIINIAGLRGNEEVTTFRLLVSEEELHRQDEAAKKEQKEAK